MVITVVAIAKNEHDMMPFFMRHYQAIADRIIVYDESDDDTPQIVKQIGGEVIEMERGNGIRDDVHALLKSQAGGQFGGDWTIVPDVDEFVYHPDLRALLADYMAHGITLPRIEGYAMIGDQLLTDGYLTNQLRDGLPDKVYSKRIIYRSNLPITYRPGAHKVQAIGDVNSPQADIKLLHYKFAFGWQWLERRLKQVVLSPENVTNGWGKQVRDIPAFRARFDYLMAHKQRVIDD
jgi:hypothetical protein